MKIGFGNGSLHVSTGNTKIGQTMNFSLLPARTCSKIACKTCYRHGCYARSLVERRKTVSSAWGENTELLMGLNGDFSAFVETMSAVVAERKPKWFRVHVGGDFFSREYFRAWMDIANRCPETRFFAFTKQWSSVKGQRIPENFGIIASHWTGCPVPEWASRRFPIAWLVGRDEPVPVRRNSRTSICCGRCDRCHYCNALTRRIGDVAFLKHR